MAVPIFSAVAADNRETSDEEGGGHGENEDEDATEEGEEGKALSTARKSVGKVKRGVPRAAKSTTTMTMTMTTIGEEGEAPAESEERVLVVPGLN